MFTISSELDKDLSGLGWTCEERVKVVNGVEFEPVLHDLSRPEDKYVFGQELVQRALCQGIRTGLCHAEAMLREQDKIPIEWRKYSLVFSEVWDISNRGLAAVYLCWCDDHWGKGWAFLVGTFPVARFVGLCDQ